MKKLLLILVCLPMSGFGQKDCGNEPIKPKKKFSQSISDYKQSKEYKSWKAEKEVWEVCKENLDTNQYYKIDFPTDPKTGLISFEKVIRCDSIPKDQIYSILREWFVTSFNDAESVLQMDDMRNGKLIGKASSKVNRKIFAKKWGTSNSQSNIWSISDIKFTLKIYIREGRFKYVLTSISFYRPYIRGLYFDTQESERDLESFLVKYPLYDKKGRVTHTGLMKNEVYLLNNMISSSLNNLVTNYLSNVGDDDW